MAQNTYRVGDYVYFETQPAAPYQIRRIEELNKETPTGAVEAKVTCFFRRRDLPNSLLKIADQAERQSQIVSKARKTLMASKEGGISANSGGTVIAATTNGEMEVPKENGLEATEPNRNSSTEPDDVKKENAEDDDDAVDDSDEHGHQSKRSYGFAGLPTGAQKLGAAELHELRQRELFLSRIVELLPATQIRGKCTVVILNEVETCDMYLDGHEDAFFYSLVYDPSNQTLLADKGQIELGERHQANIPELVVVEENEKANEDGMKKEDGEEKMHIDEEPVSSTTTQPDDEMGEARKKLGGVECTEREHVVYHPHHSLSDLEIDQFLLIARAVGTFSRALDTSSSTKLPTLHQTASAASRDVTLLHAMALLHQSNYDLGQASKFLVPPPDKQHYPLEVDKLTAHNTSILGGPILCRDQLEEWSASESTLFEDAIEKYGKDFHDVRQDCLPWKSMRDIVEYYYMWKTTSRYAELQKAKHAEQENKVKQLYIPGYNKPNANLIGTTAAVSKSGQQIPCESCGATAAEATPTTHWYNWGPALQFRVCGECWTVWKKRGGLKKPHHFDTFDLENGNDGRGGQGGNRIGSTGRNGLPQQVLQRGTAGQILVGQKGRVAFFVNAPLETRVARRMAPKPVFNVRKAARAPFHDIDHKGVQEFYFGRPISDVLNMARQVMKRGTLTQGAIEHLTKLHKKKIGSVSAEQNGKK